MRKQNTNTTTDTAPLVQPPADGETSSGAGPASPGAAKRRIKALVALSLPAQDIGVMKVRPGTTPTVCEDVAYDFMAQGVALPEGWTPDPARLRREAMAALVRLAKGRSLDELVKRERPEVLAQLERVAAIIDGGAA